MKLGFGRGMPPVALGGSRARGQGRGVLVDPGTPRAGLGDVDGGGLVSEGDDVVVSLVRALPRRARAAQLAPIDLAMGPGVHALVGTPADGTLAIAQLVGGVAPSRSATVTAA